MFEVFLKEVRELLRDRKTLFFVIALPMLIFPVIMALMGFLASQAALEAKQEVHKIYVIGEEFAPKFVEKLKYHKNFDLVDNLFNTEQDLIQAVKNKTIDAGVIIKKSPSNMKQSTWQLLYNDTKRINYLVTYVESLKVDYERVVKVESLNQLGIVQEEKVEFLLSPIKLNKVDVADPRESWGEKLGVLLPYLIIPVVLAGAMYPAIDLGAGEKERGTLETLLLTPVSRTSLILGKFLTVLTASLATASLTVLSIGFWVFIAKSLLIDGLELSTNMLTVGFMDLLSMLFLLIPLAAIFASIVLSISIYARTFKEAQNYMGPLSMLVFVPLMVSVMPNIQLNYTTAFIPVTNVALAIKELIKGTAKVEFNILIFISTFAFAFALLAFCVYWFKQEKVLFR